MTFIDNKYTKWYNSIIYTAKNRLLEGYKEKHHILPVSLGGTDSETNLVDLTAREHFICHLLLTKMVVGDSKHKMTKAARMMSFAKSNGQERYKISSRTYNIIKSDPNVPYETRQRMSTGQKTRFSLSVGTFKGKSHTDETKKKISLIRLGKKDSIETRLKKSESAKNKPPVSEETRKKISLSNKGRPGLSGEKNGFYGKKHSDEQREKKRQEKLSSTRQQCPHCSKIVDVMNYSRWHGDKCRQK